MYLHISHRKDIDGLRAIAVMSVVFFHAFPSVYAGGFIGVDIFFVISGFLISRIILENQKNNSFSYITFYIRRIKRIFPALLLVLICSFSYGYFVLLPDEFAQLGRHMLSGATFTSNYRALDESGYFDNVAETKPLLHLWSLAIEEQFYIIWPLLLGLCMTKRLSWLFLITLLMVLSFSCNLYLVKSAPILAFFSPESRFWELLIGALVAYFFINSRLISIHFVNLVITPLIQKFPKLNLPTQICLKNFISILGLSLIVLALLIINKHRLFPGFLALLPTIGAALLLLAGPNAIANKIVLSQRVMIWIGLISYPLYLWHWSLLSFARILEGDAPPLGNRMIILIISIALAWITYQVIEKGIQKNSFLRVKLAFLILLMFLVGLLGFLVSNNEIHQRYTTEILKISPYKEFVTNYAFPPDTQLDPIYGLPYLGKKSSNKIMMIGDSHLQQYIQPIDTLILNEGSNGRNLQVIIDTVTEFENLETMANRIKDDKNIDKVVLSFFWNYRYGSNKINYAIRCCGTGVDGVVGGNAMVPPPTKDKLDSLDLVINSAVATMVKAGKKVYIILDNPFGEDISPRGLIVRSLLYGIQIAPKTLTKADAIDRSEPIRSRIIQIANENNVEIIDPMSYLCDNEVCPALSSDGIPLYKDYDHLSNYSQINNVSFLRKIFK